MSQFDDKLNEWVINQIKTGYKDEVSLLLGHNTLKLDKDLEKANFSFFIPASEKAAGLARTFIIDGVGYDLFPLSWERLERMAAAEDYNTTCLGDAVIMYCRDETARVRFQDLQKTLERNLSDQQYMLKRALQKLDIAMEIYRNMLFEESFYKIRKAAGYIADYLAIAVANANQTYFKNGQTNQLSDLAAMPTIPADFSGLYQSIVKAASSQKLKTLCYTLITNTRQFLMSKQDRNETAAAELDFKGLADWYQELSYTWRRVYHWCIQDDAVRSFIWGCLLQSELDIVGEEFGLGELDLLGTFTAADLTTFRRRAETLERQIVAVIEEHGVRLDRYASITEFLEKNG